MVETPKPYFLLDTGPLSVLCGFPRNATPYIHQVLHFIHIALADGVVQEAGQGKIARTVIPLIKVGEIKTFSTSTDPIILDTAYSGLLGRGEISTIKAALATALPVILDDKDAFIVANRFGLSPFGFQDLMVTLVRFARMPRETAIEIVQTTSGQFPAAFLTHTLDKLS